MPLLLIPSTPSTLSRGPTLLATTVSISMSMPSLFAKTSQMICYILTVSFLLSRLVGVFTYFSESATGYDATVCILIQSSRLLPNFLRQMDITWVDDDITDGLIDSITVPLNMYVTPMLLNHTNPLLGPTRAPKLAHSTLLSTSRNMKRRAYSLELLCRRKR